MNIIHGIFPRGKKTFRISLEYEFIFQKDSVFKQEDQAAIFTNLL